MKKIETIVENCKDCRFCLRYCRSCEVRESAFICEKSRKVIEMGREIDPLLIDGPRILPYWCPLETYTEAEPSTPSTIILPGMPGLEWMTENLSGFGGTEIDGNTYYTWEEAMAAAEQLGDGWRLPTREEFQSLCDLGSTWDDDRKGRWFGGNHDADHAGSLFFPAAGIRHYVTGALASVGAYGYVWSSSTFASGNIVAGHMDFSATWVDPLNANLRSYGFSVRCVRNVK